MKRWQVVKGFKTITISSEEGRSTATFLPERGAMASSIVMPGIDGSRELLYQHDFFWDKHIMDLPGGLPCCFPICGRLERNAELGAYSYQGETYRLPIHGFAWQSEWAVEEEQADSVAFVLKDNKLTRAMYPFSFEVRLHYRIRNGELVCEQRYRNCGDQAMPYYAGFHPYFLTPALEAGKEEVILDYRPVRRFRYNKQCTDVIGQAPLFPFPAAVTHPDINEQLTLLGKDKMIKLRYPGGDVLRLAVEGFDDPGLFSYLQLYTEIEKPFVCVEPWMAYPNALNTVDGVRWLAPGAEDKALLLLKLNG